MLRGVELEAFNYLDFQVDTHEDPISEPTADLRADEDNEDDESEHPCKRGRKPHLRSRYLPGHSRAETRQRMLRMKGHKYLPSFVGPYFPRSDDPDQREFYCCNILALLKPWRQLSDLREGSEPWEIAYERFILAAPKELRDIISGIQYYYSCSDSANQQESQVSGNLISCTTSKVPNTHDSEALDADDVGEDSVPQEMVITEESIRLLQQSGIAERDERYVREALEVGRIAHLFDNRRTAWTVDKSSANPAIGDDLRRLEEWKMRMSAQVDALSTTSSPMQTCSAGPSISATDGSIRGGVTHLPQDTGCVEHQPHTGESCSTGSPVDAGPDGLETSTVQRDTATIANDLKPDQRRAFDIIRWHLDETLSEHEVPQLLLQVQGEGGTGKSKVIRTVTEEFRTRGAEGMLTRAAYTGMAASIIDGKTLHNVGRIPMNGKLPSQAVINEMAKAAAIRKYLVIDEVSMVSREFLAKLSAILCMIADAMGAEGKGKLPFGGINIILVGDYHQFPPIAASPLYYPIAAKDSQQSVMGRKLYEHFTNVVILRDQMRVGDQLWLDFLQHARVGECRPHHLKMLRGLILTNSGCPRTDFSMAPWNGAVLITPRHAVRKEWNRASVRRHCKESRETLFICEAEDRIKDRKLTLGERYATALKDQKANPQSDRNERSPLAACVEIAVGMEVMITFNVQTDLDIANGARGRITAVVLHEEEPPIPRGAVEVRLKYQPAYVLVQMHRTKVAELPHLAQGVIPLEPLTKTFEIQIEGGRRVVTRKQLPLTPAYAFTDIRSQGQTISHVIIDIAKPPTGGLTAFNAYVALSRSSGRDTIRLLRDFDDDLFVNPPCPQLAQEDRRLERLDAETRRWWEAVERQRDDGMETSGNKE